MSQINNAVNIARLLYSVKTLSQFGNAFLSKYMYVMWICYMYNVLLHLGLVSSNGIA